MQLCGSLIFFGIAFLWDWNENWPFPVLWSLVSFPNLLTYWMQHFPGWKSVLNPETSATVWELLWYNCFPVCGLSAWRLYGGVHTLRPPCLLQPELLSPWQVAADPCLHRRHSNTQRQFWLSLLWAPWVLVRTRFCLSPLSISFGYGVWF